MANDFHGGVDRGQQPRVQLHGPDDVLGPGTAFQVEEVGARGIGVVGSQDAGQQEGGVVLGLEYLGRAAVDFRLVCTHPEQLGGHVGGAGPMPGAPVHLLEAAAVSQQPRLGVGAQVGPEEGGAQGAPGRVKQQGAVHHAAEADDRDGASRDACPL